MQKFTRIMAILLLLIAVAESIFIFRLRQKPETIVTHQTVRDTVIDTLRYLLPVPYDSAVIRYIRVPVPTDIEKSDSLQTDTLPPDSIELPITQKVYQDSTFRAYVSGFQPQLDSCIVYPRTVYVTNNKVMHTPRKKFGWGPQIGVGITPKGFLPYAGLGIHYTF